MQTILNGIDLFGYLLATEDASELQIGKVTGTLTQTKEPFEGGELIIPQHLHICSNREIKEGDWYFDDFHLLTLKYKQDGRAISVMYHKKIEFTKDKKLIADGVPAIDGNTKALVPTKNTGGEMWGNFLSEFVLRYNQKDLYPKGHCQKEEEGEPRCNTRCEHCITYYEPIDKDNQKGVDVEKLAEKHADTKWVRTEELWSARKFGFIEGFKTNQALQDNDKKLSLEEVKYFLKIQRHECQIERNKRSVHIDGVWYVACEDILNAEEPVIQSLTKEPQGVHYPNIGEDPEYYQPKRKIEMWCEMEEDYDPPTDKIRLEGGKAKSHIKLNSDGQPIIHFK